MNNQWNETMADVTRLVGSGDLHRATALIQQRLNQSPLNESPLNESPNHSPLNHSPLHAHRAASSPFDAWARRGSGSGSAPPRAAPADYIEGVFERQTSDSDEPATGRPQQSALFSSHEYRNAAGARPYKLYVPAGDTTVARPLIVMLHGCTQNPDDFAAGTAMNALADRHGFAVAYPSQLQSANSSRCWNWFEPAHQQRDRGEPSLIAGIVADIRNRIGVDERRIHLAGFSAGGAMAVVMAARYPDLFASAAVHSGLPLGVARDVASAMAAMRRGRADGGRRAPTGGGTLEVPLIVFHGDRDTTVHPRNGEEIIDQWTGRSGTGGASGERADIVERGQAPGGRSYTRRIVHGSAGRPLLEHWRLHGAGHGWSGGTRAGTYTDPTGPDASREIVRFFGQNPRGD